MAKLLVRYSGVLDQNVEANLALLTKENFEKEAAKAMLAKKNFSFQTNFDKVYTDEWRVKFSENGFKTHLYFLYVNSTQLCIRRVEKRVAEGGHFVPEDEIVKRYHVGLKNFDDYFEKYDCVKFIDTSGDVSKIYLEISDKEIVNVQPEIVEIINQHKLPKLKNKLDKEL